MKDMPHQSMRGKIPKLNPIKKQAHNREIQVFRLLGRVLGYNC